MGKTLDMQLIRYINLFEKVSGIRPKSCFIYNSSIVFTVVPRQISRAIGENGKNVKKLVKILGKKVKIVVEPRSIEDIENFITSIVHPVKVNEIKVNGEEVIINAGRQNKALLIGRNKSRLEEMQKILEEYFGIEKVKIA